MAENIILAKSSGDPNNPKYEETLIGHSYKAIESFKSLFGLPDKPTRLAIKWLLFFGLAEEDYVNFYYNGLASCCLHDIGKANSGFQNAVRRKGAQVIRHEHLSGILLWNPEIKDWLSSLKYLINYNVVLSSIVSHHLKANHENFANQIDDVDYFLIDKDAIYDILKIAATELQLSVLSPLNMEPCWSCRKSGGFCFEPIAEEIKRSFHKLRCKFKKSEKEKRLLLAVKASLIISDSAGSGLVREGIALSAWIIETFDEGKLLAGHDIESKVLEPRIKEIESKGKKFRWNDFQEAAEDLPGRALLLAPCGSGKTLAAWRWIKSRLSKLPAKKVIFLYPTRATATEGFRDYISWAPEGDAALIHGTSKYELVDMFDNPDDLRQGKDFTTNDRLFAIGYWNKRIFSATVDQFLGFMQNSYRSVCLMPLLADSVLVVDEVHSFDRNLFDAFKRFLQNFNVPTLCMTASLSTNRKNALIEECNLSIFPTPEDRKVFFDLQKKAEMPRYQVFFLQTENEARLQAEKSLEKGKRILWVVNTVSRCQKIARDFNSLCYHSRFRLDDRKNRHKEVIDAFQKREKPVIALTTQVCEMSLDLDADVLITESAPVTSLIQRMGRCNRHAEPSDGKIGQIYIYKPEDEKPYSREDLEGADSFIKELDGRQVSQSFLEELLEKYGSKKIEPEKYSAFLEDGLWALSREEGLRDTNDFTQQAILDCDITRYLEKKRKREPIDGFIISVPRRFAQPDPSLGRFLMVAPFSHYSEKFGFFDDPLEE